MEKVEEEEPNNATLNNLSIYVEQCSNTNEEEQLKGTKEIRKLSTIPNNPPLQEIIDSGVVPVLIRHITRDENPDLQFEATWTITNIASGTSEQTKFIVDKGAVNPLLHILNSQSCSATVKNQAIWALGNIAGDSIAQRDLLLSLNIVPSLLAILETPETILGVGSTLRYACWTLSNCCRGKPPPQLEHVYQVVKPYCKIASEKSDTSVLTDAFWGLSYLIEAGMENVNELLAYPNILETILKYTKSSHITIVTPCIRILGNLATEDDDVVEKLIASGAIEVLRDILVNPKTKTSLIKELCWLFSNIAAGTTSQIQKLIDLNVIEAIYMQIKANSKNLDVLKEAIWVIANISSGANCQQYKYMLETLDSYFPTLLSIAELDNRITFVILEFIGNMFNAVAKQFGVLLHEYQPKLINDNVALFLETLQVHQNTTIADKAKNILVNYFEEQDISDDEIDSEYDITSFNFDVPSVSVEKNGNKFQLVPQPNLQPKSGSNIEKEDDDGGVGGNEYTE